MRTCLLRGWALHLPLASVICIWHDIRIHFAQTLDSCLSKGGSRTLAPGTMFAFSVSTGLRAAVRGLASILTAKKANTCKGGLPGIMIALGSRS
jgi:hypothetical protein